MTFFILYIPLFFSIISGFFGRFIGKKGAVFLCCLGLLTNFFFSFFIFLLYSTKQISLYTDTINWIFESTISIKWALDVNQLTIIMFLVVNIISTIVHVYAIEYMASDPHTPRFFSYISFFTFFMLVLISGKSAVQFFVGWEGVGLCSYLLISFWYTRINAVSSGLKALIINRVSDFSYLMSFFVTYTFLGSFDFSIIVALSQFIFLLNQQTWNGILTIQQINLFCILIFLAVMGKSAQILLHTWLPDAMEGPTPVSALIHAATMVTAGVFLLIKCASILEYTSSVLIIILLLGSLTAFISGTIGTLQYDIKKIIAYSTCSQLGYMILACGLSNYTVSFYHLANHAFFKALLFLCAGCVIHSCLNEQDLRNLGGFSNITPGVSFLMITGSLALSGFPYLSGFFSKDCIIEHIYYYTLNYKYFFIWSWACSLVIITTLLTAFYTTRLTFILFNDITPARQSILRNVHESNTILLYPLIILLLGSITVGYLFKDIFIGISNDFFSNILINLPISNALFELDNISTKFKHAMLSIIVFLGFYSLFMTIKKPLWGLEYFLTYDLIFFKYFLLFNLKWYFDLCYNRFIGLGFFKCSYLLVYELLDKIFIERYCGHFFFIHRLYRVSQKSYLIFQNSQIFIYMLFIYLWFLIINYIMVGVI